MNTTNTTNIGLTTPLLIEIQKLINTWNISASIHHQLTPTHFYYPENIQSSFWLSCSEFRKLSEEFIETFQNYLDWHYISKYQTLSESFIRKHQDKVDWSFVSQYQNLSESLILEFADKLSWYYIPSQQILTENTLTQIFTNPNLNKIKNELNLSEVCKFQTLSENFIRKLIKDSFWPIQDIFWPLISAFQNLSEPFIREFQDHVNWLSISKGRKLSEPFIKEFGSLIDQLQYSYFKEKPDELKLKEIENYAYLHNLKFDGTFLYAFRQHDNQNKGVWNKTIRYDQFGKTYQDWRCNMNEDVENSFGLGIWPELHNLSVDVNVKVKVHYKDWGCAVKYHQNGKARVSAFTLIEKL